MKTIFNKKNKKKLRKQQIHNNYSSEHSYCVFQNHKTILDQNATSISKNNNDLHHQNPPKKSWFGQKINFFLELTACLLIFTESRWPNKLWWSWRQKWYLNTKRQGNINYYYDHSMKRCTNRLDSLNLVSIYEQNDHNRH